MLPQLGDAFKGDEHRTFTWKGGRDAALLIHGFPGTPAEIHPAAMCLHELGWTVHGVLLPGFGPEIDTLGERRYEDWLGAIREGLSQLAREHERLLLVGYSMGGALALELAAKMPTAGIVLFAPFWQIENTLWHALPVLKIVLPRFKPFRIWKPDFNDPGTRDGITTFMPGVDLDDPNIRRDILEFSIPMHMIDQIRIAGQRGYAAAPKVKQPALVIQGVQDDLVQPHLTRQLVARLGGKVRYCEVEADHEVLNPVGAHWPGVNALLRDFVQDL